MEDKKMMYLLFDKLVRNGVPKLVYEENGDLNYFHLKGEKCINVLKDKLLEEAQEVVDAESIDDVADEIGDVLDVLNALVKALKINKRQLKKIHRKKYRTKGGFKKGVFAYFVKIKPEDNYKEKYKYKDITKDILLIVPNGDNESNFIQINKLIRDKVAKFLKKNKQTPPYYEYVNGEKKMVLLKNKLLEEAQEVFEAKDYSSLMEEIGDVYDVLLGIMHELKIRKRKVKKKQKAKFDFRGDFSNFVYINWVKMPVDTPEKWAKKYKRITKEEAEEIVNKNKNNF